MHIVNVLLHNDSKYAIEGFIILSQEQGKVVCSYASSLLRKCRFHEIIDHL